MSEGEFHRAQPGSENGTETTGSELVLDPREMDLELDSSDGFSGAFPGAPPRDRFDS